MTRCDLPVVQVAQFSRCPSWRRQSYPTVAEPRGGHCPGAVPVLVVDVPAIPQLQCVDKVVVVPVVQVVRGLLFLFFDKVVDMPVIAQLQHVDELVISLLCRSCSFRGARRGEDSPIPQLAIIEKIVEVPEVQYTYDGRCPCCAGVRVAPVQVVAGTAVSHSCVVEKLVEIPENEYICKVFTRRQAVAAWRRVKEPSTTKSSSSSRTRGRLLVQPQHDCFVASDSIGIGQFALTSNKREQERQGRRNTLPCVDSKHLRVCVQDASVCTGKTPACPTHAGSLQLSPG